MISIVCKQIGGLRNSLPTIESLPDRSLCLEALVRPPKHPPYPVAQASLGQQPYP